MIVTRPPQLQALIQQQVDSGRFASAEEVIEAAVRLLDERERLARLRAAIAVGDEQIARGQVVEWTPDFMDRLLAEADEADRQGLPISEDVRP